MKWTPEACRNEASAWQHANYCEGDAGFCRAENADWHYDPVFDLSLLMHLFANEGGAKAWLDDEIKMDEEEELCRGYRAMLAEDIEEEVVILVRDGKGYIWDGWHRVAAALASGRATLKAITGTPFPLTACLSPGT